MKNEAAKCGKRFLALMLSLFLAVSGLVISSPTEALAAAGTETVTIGDESSNTSSYYMPYVIYYNNGLAESIYTAEQIGTSGTISEIAYQVASASSYLTTSVMIYMGHTSKSAFSNMSDWISEDDLTLVYSGSPTLGTTAGWETITLDTEFEYNGEDNLVIAVAKKASGYSSSLRYYYTSQSGSVTLYRYSDSYSNYGEISDTTNGTMSTYLPNLQLTMATCSHENKIETSSEAATCTEAGYIEYYCMDCENTIVEEIPALGHDYQYEVTQAATCTESGLQTVTCDRSGCDYEAEEVIEPLGHDYQYEVTKEATCTEAGAQTVTCARLDCDYEEEETISPLGHTWVWGETDEDGVTTGTCSVCGATTQLMDATVTIGDEDSTSTSIYMPYYAYDKMSLAEMIYTADEIGTAGSIKQIAFQVASAASHATTSLEIYMGHTSKSSFTSAGWVSADDLTLVYSGTPTLGTASGWEEITLDTEFEYNGEDNLVIAVSRKASAYTTGLTYVVTAKSEYATLYRGSDTSDTYADVSNTSTSGTISLQVPNLQMEMSTCGHGNKVLTGTSDATCTEAGHNYYFCPDCGKTIVEDTEEALGHEYKYEVTQEPTCTETGAQTVTCTREGCDYTAEETIAALGHEYKYEVTQEPTCTETGVQTVTCTREGCDYTAEETIAALGHEWDWDNAVQDGDYLIATCTRCSETYAKNTAVSEWDGSASEIWTSGSGTEDDPYLIESAANLRYLALQVTYGTTYSGLYFQLDVDIDLGSYTWTPIGNYSSRFCGTFDGGTHTISGLFTSSSSDYQGLFGGVGKSGYPATVKNLIVQGTVTGSYYVGGIAGYAGYATFENVGNEASVGTSSSHNVGGIVGCCDGPNTFTGCYNKGTITGYTLSTSTYTQGAGGIVGTSYSYIVTMNNCYNLGTINGGYSAGGLVGCGRVAGNTLVNCYNGLEAAVTSSGTYVGSIGGYLQTGVDTLSYYGADTASLPNGLTTADYNLGTLEEYSDYDSLLTKLGSAYTSGESINSAYGGAPALAWEAGDAAEEEPLNGLYADEDGTLAYYVDSVIDTAFTGVAADEDGTLYYVEAGYVGSYTGLAEDPSDGIWYYFTESVLDQEYTGLTRNTADGILYYVADGTIDWDYTGMAKYAANGCWYYVTDAVIDWTYTGLAKYAVNGCLYYFADGQLDWTYTGMVKYSNGIWYYVTSGQLDWSFTGDVTTESGTYHFENGTIVWDYTE